MAKQVGKHHYIVHGDTNELSRGSRAKWGMVISVVATSMIAVVSTYISDVYGFGMGLWSAIPGFVLGALIVAPMFVPLARKVRIVYATWISFGLAGLCAIGTAIVLPWTPIPIANMFAGLAGLIIGELIAFKFAPRYKVYRYAACPGCGYTLVGLPKNLPCPECGRDNSDLVNKFSSLKSDPEAAD